MRRGQGTPIQVIGVLVLVILVVVAVAVFFFAGLSEQGSVLGQTSEQSRGNLNVKLDSGLACLPPVNCCETKGDLTDASGNACCSDCGLCPTMGGC